MKRRVKPTARKRRSPATGRMLKIAVKKKTGTSTVRGTNNGKSKGRRIGTPATKRRRKRTSAAAGLLRRRRKRTRAAAASYRRGYQEAYNEGYNAGFAKGFEDGHQVAYEQQ